MHGKLKFNVFKCLAFCIRKIHAHCMNPVTTFHAIQILVITASPWYVCGCIVDIPVLQFFFFAIAFFKYVCWFEGLVNINTCSDVSKLSLALLCVISFSSSNEDGIMSSLLVLTILLVPIYGFPFIPDCTTPDMHDHVSQHLSVLALSKYSNCFLAQTDEFSSNYSPVTPCCTPFFRFFDFIVETKETVIQSLLWFF